MAQEYARVFGSFENVRTLALHSMAQSLKCTVWRGSSGVLRQLCIAAGNEVAAFGLAFFFYMKGSVSWAFTVCHGV